MEFIKDRVPTHAGRVKLTPVSGSSNVFDLTRADEPREAGTPVNKKLLNDIYGFSNKVTAFSEDGKIVETDPDTGVSLTVAFNPDGSITETMRSNSGDAQVKTTTFGEGGSIREVIG